MKSVFAAVSAAALLTAAPVWAQAAAHHQSMSSQDQKFVTAAGAANLAEVQLGKLAEQKAANPAVKEFGRWMATDHTLANKRLAAVTGTQQQPKLTTQQISLKQKLQNLNGAQFDRQYVQAMVNSHEKAIKKFTTETQKGQDQALKSYASNMLPVLHQHLKEAQKLESASGVVMGSAAHPAATSGSSMSHYYRH
ncbi:MAG TPA: DUF4142 domain-containing protein [Stellaceae bacterium]|nr:DUF4142 domain-containing protein [Stellaceae bacterium]